MSGIRDLLKSRNVLIGGAALAAVILLFRKREGSEPNGSISWEPSGKPFVGSGDRVLLVGDSLAFGLKSPMMALANAAGIAFQGHGIVGTRIDEWDNKHLAGELAFNPTVIVVSLGTNDMKMFDPPKQQTGHVQSLLTKARAAGARVAWIIPPTMPFQDKGVRAMIESAAPDLALHAENLDLPRAADQIHMTPSGYKAFAQAVWDCLTKGDCP